MVSNLFWKTKLILLLSRPQRRLWRAPRFGRRIRRQRLSDAKQKTLWRLASTDGADASATKKSEDSSKRHRSVERSTQSDVDRDAGVADRTVVGANWDACPQKVSQLNKLNSKSRKEYVKKSSILFFPKMFSDCTFTNFKYCQITKFHLVY